MKIVKKKSTKINPKIIRQKVIFYGSDDWRVIGSQLCLHHSSALYSYIVLTLDDDINDGDDLDSGDDDAGVYVKSMPG